MSYRIKYCPWCDDRTGHDQDGVCEKCGKADIEVEKMKNKFRPDTDIQPKLDNDFMQKLDRESRLAVNHFRIGENETLEHALGKAREVWLMFKSYGAGNVDFIMECYSEDRSHRADIIFFVKGDTPRVVEIAVNEDDLSIIRKRGFWNNLGFGFDARRIE